ncbi:MAG: ETC complex I subunit [Alphaproteobacteria bacterium]
MQVRIYRPAKSAMQSGQGGTRRWILEFEPQSAKVTDPMMGWVGSADVYGQVRMFFETKEEAIAYAARRGLECQVDDPHERIERAKSYADNFRPDRIL